MAIENALAYLRAAEVGRPIPPAAIIFGPHAFLREQVLDSMVRALRRDGFQRRGFQAITDFSAVLAELREADLFAPKRAIVCRIGKSRRGGEADGEAADSGARGGETELAAAIEDARSGDNHLILIYERDNAPAKIRRAAEKSALAVNCMRPFDNQLDQYARLIAAGMGLKLDSRAAETLVARHAGDLAAIANALEKAAIFSAPGRSLRPADFDEPAGARRMPEAFEIADSIARGRTAVALAQIARAAALSRDAIEILAVEIVPALRRMTAAAAMLAAQKREADAAAALGFPPHSPIVARAIEGARRYGIGRLERASGRACELDARFKNGTLKERETALAGLLLDLMA
ncbi:MAG: DNA polymerase III subunit delta [Candidatus Binataceae bacterium]